MCRLCMLFLFLLSHEHCGCYGSGNSQIAAKTYGSLDDSITIQASLMKLGNDIMLIMHIILFLLWHENRGCYGNGNNQIVAKTYGSPDLG